MSDLDTDTVGIPYAAQQLTIQVAQACASLSFLGSTVIVVAYFRFKQVSVPLFRGLVSARGICTYLDRATRVRVAGLPSTLLRLAIVSRLRRSTYVAPLLAVRCGLAHGRQSRTESAESPRHALVYTLQEFNCFSTRTSLRCNLQRNR